MAKPLGQDEKDRRGRAELAARQAEQVRAERAASRARWHPDERLGDLDKDGLLAEADLRKVAVKKGWSKDRLVEALRKASSDADVDPAARVAEAEAPLREAADADQAKADQAAREDAAAQQAADLDQLDQPERKE